MDYYAHSVTAAGDVLEIDVSRTWAAGFLQKWRMQVGIADRYAMNVQLKTCKTSNV